MSSSESRSVLITGCSTGIGRALAQAFHAAGFRTFASARRLESMADLEAAGIGTLRLDVGDAESVKAAAREVVERAGRLDVLVNNAGINAFGPLMELPSESLRAVFDTNVLGLVTCCQAVFPAMAEQGSGQIINIGSVAGVTPTPFAGAYCATKSAVHMLSDVLRMEVAPLGIEITVVQPGGVRSQIAATGSRGLERYDDASSRYHAVRDQIHKRANASQDNPMEAEAFAQEVVEAVSRRPAPRVVRAGAGADAIPKLAELPGEQLDQIMTAQFGLDALRKP